MEKGKVDKGTKESLVDAAATLLDAGGQAAVTLRAVAELVGLSHNAPYRHFRDRTALLAGVAARDVAALGEVFAVAAGDEPMAALRRAAGALVDFARRHPARYRLLFSEPGLAQAEGLHAAAMGTFQAFCALVLRGQAAGYLPPTDPLRLAGLLYAALHGALDLELGGRASSAKGLGGAEDVLGLLLDLLGRREA